MPKFKVSYQWSGYSRGYSVCLVEADSKEEAMECAWDGELIEHVVIRDDTEKEDFVAEEVTEEDSAGVYDERR